MEKRMQTNTPGPVTSGPKPFTFDRVVRLLITIAVIAACVWLVGILKSVLLPFFVAWLIAYILEPFVQYNKRLLRVRKRWLPILMTLFECVLLLTVLAIFLLPSIIHEMHQVANFLAHYADAGSDIPFIPASLHEYLRKVIDFDMISRELTRQDLRTIFDTAASFITGGYNIVMGIFNWFIVILYVVFIMIDYEKFIKSSHRLIPPKYRDIATRIAKDVKESMNNYFRGQALVAFIVGILFCIGLSIVGLPMAIVMGLFIGLLNMVPYLQLISLLPTTLLCLVYSANVNIDFWQLWLATMTVYIVVQLIQDFFLTPKIMGKAMSLNPAIILLSLSVWGTLLGFIGLIIALPLTTLLLAYYNIYINSRDEAMPPPHQPGDATAITGVDPNQNC